MTADNPEVPLRDFFAGIAQYTFESRLGVADPALVDYITDLLTRFIRCDALYTVRDLSGQRLAQVGQMIVEAESRVGDARREAHRHIGDFTLFWTGVYPEALRQASSYDDRFVTFCTQGKRAYHIASTIPTSAEKVERDVLLRLSEEFELCAYGLNEARREWERHEGEGPRPLVVFN